jgi:hypothetical protein
MLMYAILYLSLCIPPDLLVSLLVSEWAVGVGVFALDAEARVVQLIVGAEGCVQRRVTVLVVLDSIFTFDFDFDVDVNFLCSGLSSSRLETLMSESPKSQTTVAVTRLGSSPKRRC